MKPFASSCEENKDSILSVIAPLLRGTQSVLEIGSGTGQHAVHFGEKLPQLRWYTSDQEKNHAGIKLWLKEAQLENVHGPLPLDVNQADWGEMRYDAIFSANSVHIMHWDSVVSMFQKIPEVITAQGQLLLYGPFNYNGEFTSSSNAKFDLWLKERDPVSGVRDFEALNELAETAGLALANDVAMPANNRILHWKCG